MHNPTTSGNHRTEPAECGLVGAGVEEAFAVLRVRARGQSRRLSEPALAIVNASDQVPPAAEARPVP